ncbi:MAG: hypothetical protein HZB16_06225 [Armatimonadetes bacterium]|nr:hypothetical protein [Armatimonadota bacterium]
MSHDCPGCGVTVRLAAGEIDRLLAAYVAASPEPLADEAVAARRLAVCRDCADLRYGTTCRHCGCLVDIRARLAARSCPAPSARW